MRRQVLIFAVFLVLALGLMPEVLVRIGTACDAYTTDVAHRLSAPSASNVFGTDSLGRDHFARSMLATGLSLRVAGQAFVLAFILALLLGSVAGLYKGRWPDQLISYIVSLIHTVPFILLAVALAAVLQASLEVIYAIVGGIAWAPPARIVRAEVARMRESRFVIAQKAYGMSAFTIFFRSILPAVAMAPFVSLLYLLPELIGLDVGLSYFGLGAQPPLPTLGRLIFDGLGFLRTAWWISLLPALVLMAFFLLIYAVMPKGENQVLVTRR